MAEGVTFVRNNPAGVVWKFGPFFPDWPKPVTIPGGGHIVHFADQNGALFMWALLAPEDEPVIRTFIVVGTGWTIPPGTAYVQTAIAGEFVWHLCEVYP